MASQTTHLANNKNVEIPAILDIEASGFGRGSYPIEIGVALPDGNRLCVLVRPEHDWQHWDLEAARLHGITRDTLLQRGLPVIEVARMLNEQLRGMTLYSDAWANDSSWLGLLYESAGFSQLFKLESLRALLCERCVQHWNAARQRVMDRYDFDRHRASNDAIIIQQTVCEARAAAACSRLPGARATAREGITE